MKKYLFLIILFLIYSCKHDKIILPEKKVIKEQKNESHDEVMKIAGLYRPEKMVAKGKRKGTYTEKENYQITITNSNLLDNDIENIESHAQKIAIIYHKSLMKTIPRFNFKKIIVKIKHKNAKSETFEYSEENISQLLNLK